MANYYMTPEEQAENVASAREFLALILDREVAAGRPTQGQQFDMMSATQSAITSIMVAAVEDRLGASALIHAIGFSVGTYLAQCDALDAGLVHLGKAIEKGVKACAPMMAEPAGRA